MQRAREGRPNEEQYTTLADIKNNARQQQRMQFQQQQMFQPQQPQQSGDPPQQQQPFPPPQQQQQPPFPRYGQQQQQQFVQQGQSYPVPPLSQQQQHQQQQQAGNPSVLQKRSYSTMTSEDSGSNKKSSNRSEPMLEETDMALTLGPPPPSSSQNNNNTMMMNVNTLEPRYPAMNIAAIPGGGAGGGGGGGNQPNSFGLDRDNSGILSDNSSFDNSHQNGPNSGSGSGQGGGAGQNGSGGSGNIIGEPPQPMIPAELANQQPNSAGLPRKPFSFKALRFERIGSSEWKIKELLVFDLQKFIESLANLNISQVFLINELKLMKPLKNGLLHVAELNADHEHQQRISDVFGLTTLEGELNKVSSVITSWQATEIPQCQQFLTSFYHHYFDQNDSNEYINNGVTLYDFWHQFDPREFLFANERQRQKDQEDQTDQNAVSNNTINTNTSSTNSSGSKYQIMGCVGYEVSNSLILIIRKNSVLGVVNDIWCKIYPNDLMHAMDEVAMSQREEDEEQKKSKPSLITFGNILVYFFPQLLLLEKRIKNIKKTTHVNTLSDVFIKYYAFNKVDISHMNNLVENKDSPDVKGVAGTGGGGGDHSEHNSSINSGGGGSGNDIYLPACLNPSAYQTIGTFNTPARKAMTR
jgi:hypothetical protein